MSALEANVAAALRWLWPQSNADASTAAAHAHLSRTGYAASQQPRGALSPSGRAAAAAGAPAIPCHQLAVQLLLGTPALLQWIFAAGPVALFGRCC